MPRAAALAPTGEAPTAAAPPCRDPVDRAATGHDPVAWAALSPGATTSSGRTANGP
ncbi:hypothetical protein ACIGCZ_23045 [Streptomyces nigra]|uniref:hypothetical protein n=1 Tax=Streptomyces nigra TaxID=1827580 RepID=UPI0037D98212